MKTLLFLIYFFFVLVQSALATDESKFYENVNLQSYTITTTTNMIADSDSGGLKVGDGQDMSVTYDGTVGHISADLVAPSDLHIGCGTDKTIILDETVWDDLAPVPIIGARLGSSAPTIATFITDIEQYTFDATNDYVIGATEVTHKWKEGTRIYPHVHWATNGVDGTARGVNWRLHWTSGDSTEVFSGQNISTVDSVIPASTPDRTHYISDFVPSIDATTLKIGSYICWRFSRIATAHANGGPAADPFGLAVGFHIEEDSIGSRTKSDK